MIPHSINLQRFARSLASIGIFAVDRPFLFPITLSPMQIVPSSSRLPRMPMFLPFSQRFSRKILLTATSLAVGAVLSWASPNHAQSTATDPATATTLVEIDAAANSGDLDSLMQFYSRRFTTADGMTYNTLSDSLENLWERFPDLTYQTELLSSTAEGGAIVAETRTILTGTEQVGDRPVQLTATITARQRLENGQIVHQEILSERSQLTSGDQPPAVLINLPESVAVNEAFTFDAIVEEPLGDRYLMGVALEEAVQPEAYLNPAAIELELLTAGGLFKSGRAPATPGDRWISAVLVRQDGMTIVTQRLRVVP